MYGSVDKVENSIITIVFDNNDIKTYPQGQYPHLVAGDTVFFDGNKLVVDENERDKRRARISNLLKKIKKRSDRNEV